MQNIRLVTFDVMGTVLKFARPPVHTYVEVGSSYGIKAELKSMESSYIVFEDALAALKRVKALEVKVGVITNFDNRIHDIISTVGIRQYIDFIVTSEDARSSKPEEKIFEFASR